MKKSNMTLGNLDSFFQKIGQLTKLQRLLISVGTAIVIIAVFGYLQFLPKFDRMDELNGEIKTSQQKLKQVQKKAQRYKALKKRYDEAQAQFKIVSRALPEKEEIPSLLTGISQAGKDSGLKFLLFEPQSEKVKDFYAEIPIKMELSGGYHDLGLFFDKLARLSRVVNVENFSITAESRNPGGELKISCTAVTYKFIEQKKKPANKK
ncbi:MAG: type 4a pilus biogenesis protein PilO [Desulfobacterales bacterium]|nr:type 4a pilus biogenesis protein PilO [Desulfobacterales bacterium]